jgi:hypothetical protein
MKSLGLALSALRAKKFTRSRSTKLDPALQQRSYAEETKAPSTQAFDIPPQPPLNSSNPKAGKDQNAPILEPSDQDVKAYDEEIHVAVQKKQPGELDTSVKVDEIIDEAGEESFPASDPPSYMAPGDDNAPHK